MIKDSILKGFTNKRCLVTGGTGLIGGQVVDILCGAGANVRTVSLDREGIDRRAWHIWGDLTSLELCKGITRGIDYVFHFRSQEANIVSGQGSATLTAKTCGGEPITGTDLVNTVGK